MPDNVLAQLREPFPDEQVRKRPEITCTACAAGSCGEHSVESCETCHRRVTTQHEHVEYIGHTDVTDRLLKADPHWYWEPFALDHAGLPAFDPTGGLWIKLVVHDAEGFAVVRSGYGSPYGQAGPDGVKAAVSDAIRNAANRFGVGLQQAGQQRNWDVVPGRPGIPSGTKDERQPLWDLIAALSTRVGRTSNSQLADHWHSQWDDTPIGEATIVQLTGYLAVLGQEIERAS